ncbi:MAG: hypothetical protein JO041_10570 [Acidobacteria bacterium]|nr:hypothetical protein [Acidobacteriota bacterium]
MPPHDSPRPPQQDGKPPRPRRMPLEAALQNATVRDRARALTNLAAIAGRVTSSVMATLPSLLSESPDPDTALNGFERFTASATPQTLRILDRHNRLIHYVLVVCGYSPYLSDTLIQNPDLLQSFAKPRELEKSYSAEDYRLAFAHFGKASPSGDLSGQMTRFRRRQYVRIMLRDVLGIATLADATAELSALADALIGEALQAARAELRSRYGGSDEDEVAVVSLGKLGGNELNYSSDIDLLFLYSGDPAARRGEVSVREYNIRLAQRTTELLGRLTPEGPVYRVDLRLRPRGAEGEPAVGLAHALRYYHDEAHDWELQAMIKARHTAGDTALTRRFLQQIEPIVYRATINFAAIETALIARRRISQRRAGGLWARSPNPGVDVKVGRGGIRDIEFLAQCLQRVYAGAEPWLRSRGTLFALQKLHDKGHLSGRDYHELSSGYAFLRTIEHRLQLRYGQQTHRIPAGAEDLFVLGRSIGGLIGQQPPERIAELVAQRMAAVSEIYARIIHEQEAREASAGPLPEFQLSPSSEMGAATSLQQVLRRLAVDSPETYALITARELSPYGRRNLFRFFAAAMTSGESYSVVLAHPAGVERAMSLFEISDFVTDELVRHPEEVGTLDHLESGNPGQLTLEAPVPGSRPMAQAAATSASVLAYVSESALNLEHRLSLLRSHYRRRVFSLAAHDLLQPRPVFVSLAAFSQVAADAVVAAFAATGGPPGLAIMALGRLGTLEFDYGSDADLIFVHDPALPLYTATAAATEVVHALAAYTSEGALFPVDTRLRPRGSEGELVVTPEQLSLYFAGEARPWEALSYTKLRPLAGDAELAQRALAAVRGRLPRFANQPEFSGELREMRSRLESLEAGEGEMNFKTSPGGTYDIDFIASELLVAHGAAGLRGNLQEVLFDLRARSLLEGDRCSLLVSGATLIRTLDHATRLVTGRARKWLPAAERPAAVVMRVAAAMLAMSAPDIPARLRSTMLEVRSIFNELIPAAPAQMIGR